MTEVTKRLNVTRSGCEKSKSCSQSAMKTSRTSHILRVGAGEDVQPAPEAVVIVEGLPEPAVPCLGLERALEAHDAECGVGPRVEKLRRSEIASRQLARRTGSILSSLRSTCTIADEMT